MANLVNLENVGKSYGTTAVLDGVSLGIADGDRIGVVGRNGGGKTTLLRLITGAEPPDSGRVTRHRRAARRDGRPARRPAGRRHASAAVVVGDGAEHEWAGDAAVREVLAGLGLASRRSGRRCRRGCPAASAAGSRWPPRWCSRPTCSCWTSRPTISTSRASPGWPNYLRRRGAARCSSSPTIAGSSTRCARGPGRSATATVRQFDGGYAAYVLARAERARQADASESRRQNLLRKELAWLRRGAAGPHVQAASSASTPPRR